jgi:PAS domain-containing protein
MVLSDTHMVHLDDRPDRGASYALTVDIRLRAFPSRDREFARYARAALAALGSDPTPDELRRSLRARYPAASVSVQTELARHGDGQIVWYALRTSALGEPLSPDRPIEAWAIVDDERRFLDMSPSLATIVELPARHILGHRIDDFTSPDDPTIRDDITDLWTEFTKLGSIASTVRFNFADGRPRELEYRLVANADGPGRHRLLVWVMPPSPR